MVESTWANCKYGEITEIAHGMVQLGCTHPKRTACPICTNNPECPYQVWRFRHLEEPKP